MAVSFSGLDSYILSGIKVTDRTFGRGVYATVLELEYMGLKCAGKKIHDLLFAQGKSTYAVEHFRKECHLLSRLHHPNITQFLGIYFEENSQAPILVMEYLPTNLTTCIDDYGVLPEEIGYPILHDVALGLCYLHNQKPPIIHRDLSSNNVLLTANLTAKISDLGVARILNVSPLQASRMTQIPGTPSYMPPEAMLADPKYDVSVDLFSLGVMMVHVFCGKWPEPQMGQIRLEGGKMIPVSEAERRKVFLDDIGGNHTLMGVILQCIDNDPQLRPSTEGVVKQLAKLTEKFGSNFSKQLDTLVRSRTESVQGTLMRSISEGGETGGIKRRPVVKKKPSKELNPKALGGSKSVSLNRGLQLQLAISEKPTTRSDVFERVRAFEESVAVSMTPRNAQATTRMRKPQTGIRIQESSTAEKAVSEKISCPVESNVSRRVNPPFKDRGFVRKLSTEQEVTVDVKEDDDDHDYENMKGRPSLPPRTAQGAARMRKPQTEIRIPESFTAEKPVSEISSPVESNVSVAVGVKEDDDNHGYENMKGQPSLPRQVKVEPPTASPPPPFHPICVAKYSYTARGAHELSFRKGDLFKVTLGDRNWWMARSMDTGDEGIVPSNYMSIPLKELEIDPRQVLLVKRIGAGHFSTVWEGFIHGKFPVAVKVLKSEMMSSVDEFLKNVTLTKLLSCPKVVHVDAVCTKKMPVYVVYELMKHGNLLRYLRSDGRSLKVPQLIMMASNVAEGAAYLEDRGYIHRDIAARNILVGESLVCKLANFHLARRVHGEFYEAPAEEKVPIKWTALEAALYKRFSIKSDVWSFGIILYEIVTYGRFPYSGMTNAQVLEKLLEAYRMSQPIGCPRRLYDIMLDCWRENTNERPTFKELQGQLSDRFSFQI